MSGESQRNHDNELVAISDWSELCSFTTGSKLHNFIIAFLQVERSGFGIIVLTCKDGFVMSSIRDMLHCPFCPNSYTAEAPTVYYHVATRLQPRYAVQRQLISIIHSTKRLQATSKQLQKL